MKFRLTCFAVLAMAMAGCQVEDPAKTTGNTNGNTKAPETGSGKKHSVAFVTNQIADFWKIAEAGCVAASKEFNIDVQVIMPPKLLPLFRSRRWKML